MSVKRQTSIKPVVDARVLFFRSVSRVPLSHSPRGVGWAAARSKPFTGPCERGSVAGSPFWIRFLGAYEYVILFPRSFPTKPNVCARPWCDRGQGAKWEVGAKETAADGRVRNATIFTYAKRSSCGQIPQGDTFELNTETHSCRRPLAPPPPSPLTEWATVGGGGEEGTKLLSRETPVSALAGVNWVGRVECGAQPR